MKSDKKNLAHTSYSSKTYFGFWLYLMTDCVLFASLFATYAVLRTSTAGGPTGSELFDMSFILAETLILLTSSLTAGLAFLFLKNNKSSSALKLFGLTLVLGIAFLSMELYEFSKLVSEGHSWETSAFLSSYFTLVGTHGLHILVGVTWLAVLMYLIASKGVTNTLVKRAGLFTLFWHFLDIIWIFIFSIVYLMSGVEL